MTSGAPTASTLGVCTLTIASHLTQLVDYVEQGHVLGYVLRQQLLCEVRREYEQISDSIQTPELLQKLPLPLANETICWPHKNMLCYPAFTLKAEGSPEPHHGCHDNLSHVENDDERDDLSTITDVSTREEEVSASMPHPSPLTDRTACPHATSSPLTARAEDGQFDSAAFNSLILPGDSEALLELRSQLTMELLWIKQAIASRQGVSYTKSTQIQIMHV